MNLIPRNQIFDIDSLFNDFFHGYNKPLVGGKQSEALAGMRVDVYENEKSYEIHADLPGVQKEDIDIRLENDILSVSASKNSASEEKKEGKVIYRERSSGMLSRSFHVAPGTSQEDVQANFSDGVLTLSVPKREAQTETETIKQIPIK